MEHEMVGDSAFTPSLIHQTRLQCYNIPPNTKFLMLRPSAPNSPFHLAMLKIQSRKINRRLQHIQDPNAGSREGKSWLIKNPTGINLDAV